MCRHDGGLGAGGFSALYLFHFGRLLDNEHVQLMWFSYCNTDRVELDSFLLAVGHYLSDQLRMPADTVQAVLDPKCLDALSLAVDVNDDKQVGNQPAPTQILKLTMPMRRHEP